MAKIETIEFEEESVDETEAIPPKPRKIKAYMKWATGLLLGVPALINAGVDAYNAVLNIPIGKAETLNQEKRSEHFQKEPIFNREIEIPHGESKKVLKLFVYENADIYVNYSGYEQWLPSEQLENPGNSFIPNFFSNAAHAAEPFGQPKALISPQQLGDVIDLKSLEQQRSEESQKMGSIISRAYWFEEINENFGLFSESTQKYTKNFNALDGYEITSYRIDVASINNAEIVSQSLSEDKSKITLKLKIKSGPFFDRWRGWIKAQVITEQKKLVD